MDPWQASAPAAWPWLALLGLAIGTLQGFFGVGGGWLTTPALNMLGLPITEAIGTGFAVTACSAVFGSVRHHRLGNLDLRLAAIVGLSGMLGIEAAKGFVLALDRQGMAQTAIGGAYIALLWGVGLSIVLEQVRGRTAGAQAGSATSAQAEPTTRLAGRLQAIHLPPNVRLVIVPLRLSIWVLAAVGLLVGLVSGALGVGGGFILVPLLIYGLGISTRVAVASSLASIVLSATYGAATYASAGRLNLVAAGLVFAGALVGVQLGAQATVAAPVRAMRVLLGAALLLAGLAVVLHEFRYQTVSLVVMFSTAFGMTAVILGFLVRGRPKGPTALAQR